jgi:hypothetical protein
VEGRIDVSGLVVGEDWEWLLLWWRDIGEDMSLGVCQ